MRAWLVVCLAACSFTPGGVPSPVIDAPADGSGSPSCGPSYTASPHSYDHAFYRLTQAQHDFAGAQSDCMVDGGRLVKITGLAQNNFVQQQIVQPAQESFVWIGLSSTVGGQFFWTDKTPLGPFNNFAGGSVPTMTGCVDFDQAAGEWSTYNCTYAHRGVCQCP